MRSQDTRTAAGAALLLLATVACGDGGESSSTESASGGVSVGGSITGGAGLGGATTGGATTGGVSGGVATGGTGTGGASSGGTATGGGATGGASVGGLPAVGGDPGLGGTSGSGGAPLTGGAAPIGGGISDGGTPAGGTPPDVGGTPPVGGEAGGGGVPAGGAPSAGAPSTGGAGTGGTTGPDVCTDPPTGVPSNVITFNDDGGWCWYQDERAIVDPDTNQLVFSSVATGGGRNGNIEAVLYDLDGGGNPARSTLGHLNPDDHNVAGLLRLSAGSYLALWAGHNQDCNTYYSTYSGGSWSSQKQFAWGSQGCPWNNRSVTYNNVWWMGDEIYDYSRTVDTSPNLISSNDNGSSWSYDGRLSSTPTVGYVAGYYKYWGNNRDRIDFFGTEAHPRDNDNSLYHGYIQDGKSYDSSGAVVDDNIHDGQAPNVTDFTRVFAANSQLGSVTLNHMWNHDLMRYDDGTIVALFQGRIAGSDANDPDKRFGYARFDGTSWKTKYLVKGGHKLYADEQDYTGLSAVHPNDPHVIYVSTTTDPRDDTTSFSKHEIWRGITCDEGETFSWSPITENSTQDNLRPIVPYWDSDRTVLLWMRGSYNSAQTFDTSIVGVILDGR